jgi:hypothetical protein
MLSILAACTGAAGARVDDIDERSRQWLGIYSDRLYYVAVDTAHLDRQPLGTYLVWFRTDHREARYRSGSPYVREISQTLISCDSLFFKVKAVDLLAADGKVVSRQRATDVELKEQQWRRVRAGTSDHVTAVAACQQAIRRRPRRG